MTNEELIERLRQLELRITAGANETCRQAADAIERLTAQLAEAKQAERAAVVGWLRAGAGQNVQNLDRSTKALFLRGLHSYANAIEAGEHLA